MCHLMRYDNKVSVIFISITDKPTVQSQILSDFIVINCASRPTG